MKFCEFMYHYKIKFFIKRFYEKYGLDWFQSLFNFQTILCKKESEEVSMLIWTNFNSFAIINM